MEHSSKVYARKILLVHVGLLIVVLGIVALATRQVYNSARQQAIWQAGVRQELLAAQTGRGIESFYTSIISDLDLLRRAEPDENTATTSPSTAPAPAGPVFGPPLVNPMAARGQLNVFLQDASPILWNQLSGRVSAIFDYNRTGRDPNRRVRVLEPRSQDAVNVQMQVGRGQILGGGDFRGGNRGPQGGGSPGRGFEGRAPQDRGPGDQGPQDRGPQDRGGPGRGRPATRELGRAAASNFARGFAGRNDPTARYGAFFAFGGGTAATRPETVPASQWTLLTDEARALTETNQTWLEQVTRPAVSRLLSVRPGSLLQHQTTAGGVNLVCVPVIEGGPRMLVAVVPATEIQDRFLPVATERNVTSATLVDENFAVIASTTPKLAGMNLKDADDPAIRGLLADYAANPRKNTQAFEQAANSDMPPRLATVEPIDLPQTKWCLLITSPVDDVDTVVEDVFRTVLYWAAFLVISMTAILVSTAVSLIRLRVRFERVQHEVITRELSQARQIQLNWLPNRHTAGPALDIAAINQPASHISGDFYNWFDLPDGRQVITIGDVTGHGMAAAFLMATTQLLVRTTMARVRDPGACMEEVNRQLCTQVFHGQFVTMLIVVLDLEHSQLELATAGHAAPLISEGGGPFTPLTIKSQLVLAVDSEQTYPTERYKFAPRSSMLLYTDGVVDVQAENDQRFDGRRLREILSGTFDSAQGIIDRVVNAVNAFRGKRELGDDLTLVAIQTQPVPRGAHLTEVAAEQRGPMTVGAE